MDGVWRRGAIRTERYWRLPQGKEERWTTEEAEEELDRLLKQFGARAPVVRRSVGRVAERRIGFLQPGALRRRSLGLASEDFFHHVSWPQL